MKVTEHITQLLLKAWHNQNMHKQVVEGTW